MKIFLSVGHSILKSGACTSADGRGKGGVLEYMYCKELASLVREYLEQLGNTVYLCICPEKKFSKSTEEKAFKIPLENSGNYDLAAELHLNAFDGSAQGCEVLYTSNRGKPYAERIVKKLAERFKNRGAKNRENLYFLNKTKAPAVIIESFFCDNVNDCKLGLDKREVAKLIAEGITGKTFQSVPKPSESSEKGTLYRVQVGAYSKKENADKMVTELKAKGFDAIVKCE